MRPARSGLSGGHFSRPRAGQTRVCQDLFGATARSRIMCRQMDQDIEESLWIDIAQREANALYSP
jgi:hypothetical protein